MALSREQRRIRRIGGSSAAVVMGLSKYKRPEELRREISYSVHGVEAVKEYLHDPSDENVEKEVQRLESDLDNIHVRVGTFLEDFVRERLKTMGVAIRKKTQPMIHPDFPFVSMNIDGRESDTVEEIKCISVYRKKEFGDEWTDEVPMDYACQTHHYMLFPQFNHARLRCLFLADSEKELIDRMVRNHIAKHVPELKEGDEAVEVEIPRYGSIEWSYEKQEEYKELPVCKMNLDVVRNLVAIAPLRTYQLEKDPIVSGKLVERYKDFWHRAQNNIPCIPETLEDCQILFDGYASGKSMIATDKMKSLAAERSILDARMKSDKKKLSGIISELMIMSDENDIVLGSAGKPLFKLGQKFSPSKDDGPLLEYCKEQSIDINGFMKTDVVDWKLVEKKLPEVFQKCRKKTARGIQWPKGK